MIRKIIPTLAILLASALAQAQDDTTKQALRVPCLKGNYISLEAGYGIQTIGMDLLQPGTSDKGFGLDLKLGYRYYFYDHFGLGIGLRYQKYQSSATLHYTQAIDSVSTGMYSNFQYIRHLSVFDNFEEKQTVQMLEVPVEMLFQWNIARRWKLGLALGLQANIFDIKNSYEQGSGTLSTQGLEYQTNTLFYNLDDDEDNLHFQDGISVPSGSYKYDLSISGIGSLSFMYAINYHLDLTMALNAGYGISRLCQNYSAQNLFDPDYQVAEDGSVSYGTYNGAFNTQVSKPHLLSLGASIGLRYRFGKETPMELDFENARRARKLQDTDGMDFNISDTLAFDDVKHRRRHSDQDSIEMAERERRRHKTDSIDIVFTDTVPQIVEPVVVQPVDSVVEQPVVDVKEPEPVVVDEPKPEPVPTPIKPDPLARIDSLIAALNNNNCEFSKSDANQLKKQSAMLDELANLLKDNPEVTIDAFGHTCDIGSLEANKTVGLRRAQSIKQELVNRGVDASRISCESKWWKEPLVPNTSEKNRAKNRRYELERDK